MGEMPLPWQRRGPPDISRVGSMSHLAQVSSGRVKLCGHAGTPRRPRLSLALAYRIYFKY